MELERQAVHEVFIRADGAWASIIAEDQNGGSGVAFSVGQHPPPGNVERFGNSMTSYHGQGNSLEPVHQPLTLVKQNRRLLSYFSSRPRLFTLAHLKGSRKLLVLIWQCSSVGLAQHA